MNVYLDYAATTPLDHDILKKMLPFMTEEFGNPDSLHGFGRRAAHAVTEARDRIAHALCVTPSEVYFTSGGTEANNWAARYLGSGRAVASVIEHASHLSALARRAGGFSLVGAEANGIVPAEQFEEALTPETGLVSLMAVNNETGCIQPYKEVANLCHVRGIPFFSDCVQAASTQNLIEILRYADAVSLSAHKLYGPKGVGALIVKKGTPLQGFLVGGEQERGLRAGTQNVANIVGFSLALERAQKERAAFSMRAAALSKLFRDGLYQLLGGEVEIDGENRAPNILHVTFHRGGKALLSALDLCGVACSGGAACSAHAAEPSHVMLAMGKTEEDATQGIRFSIGKHTTEEHITAALKAIGFCIRG